MDCLFLPPHLFNISSHFLTQPHLTQDISLRKVKKYLSKPFCEIFLQVPNIEVSMDVRKMESGPKPEFFSYLLYSISDSLSQNTTSVTVLLLCQINFQAKCPKTDDQVDFQHTVRRRGGWLWISHRHMSESFSGSRCLLHDLVLHWHDFTFPRIILEMNNCCFLNKNSFA